MRLPKRPFLPGNTINLNTGQTRFHKSHQLDFVVKGVPYITEKCLPGIGGIPLQSSRSDIKPSVYALGEVVKLPPWLVFDKHVLVFDSYYLQKLDDTTSDNYIVHQCKIYFFLEDGTIKVVEQRNPFHDGLSSGCIIHRQRIRYPAEGSEDFYDILDLNIGNDVEFFGKLFRLIDCDEFTRKFLNRLGIFVPDKLPLPEDPLSKNMKEIQTKKIKPLRINKKLTLDEFLCDANRKLTFHAYWDDRDNENGAVHLLLVIYYIVDETIEIKDVTDKNKVVNVLKREKLKRMYNIDMKVLVLLNHLQY
uniref:Putative ef-hand domain-containing family member c2-like protein n=1 Tax=Rhodnius prolixus TaxID=13249 RepID=A0A4P6D9F9_RHOPR